MVAPAPKSRPTPPAARRNSPPSQPPAPTARAVVSFGKIEPCNGHRTLLYGPGGAGKTTLAATAPGPVAFFDFDGSLPVLGHQLGELPIMTVNCPPTWQGMRDALHGTGWEQVRTIVIDTATAAEDLAIAWTLENVPHPEYDTKVDRIEGYGYGKGYQFVYETFLMLLGDLDQHVRAGRHVILVCHDCVNTVPNPAGEDWIRWEPRLQSPPSGKAATRLRIREWADHVLFVGYDVAVKTDPKNKRAKGKGVGVGTRTIWPQELPHCMAKSRSLADPLELVKFDTTIWDLLFGTAE